MDDIRCLVRNGDCHGRDSYRSTALVDSLDLLHPVRIKNLFHETCASKEDIKKNVAEEIETILQEKEVEKARKDRKNNLINNI